LKQADFSKNRGSGARDFFDQRWTVRRTAHTVSHHDCFRPADIS